MKKALNGWTVSNELGFRNTFKAVSGAGFDGIELNVDAPGANHALSMASDEALYSEINALSKEYKLPVVSISTSLWGDKMGVKSEWDAARALLRKQIEAASALGAGGILTVPGGMGSGISLKTARENCIAFLKSMKDEIEEKGIFVGVENVWNGFFLSPYDMASFIDEIGSSKIGAYFDAGNMLAFSVSEYWAEILSSRIGYVHVKDFKRNGGLNSGGRFVDITHGSADWSKIIPALREAGFDGHLTGEVFNDSMPFEEYYTKVSDEIGEIIKYSKQVK